MLGELLGDLPPRGVLLGGATRDDRAVPLRPPGERTGSILDLEGFRPA